MKNASGATRNIKTVPSLAEATAGHDLRHVTMSTVEKSLTVAGKNTALFTLRVKVTVTNNLKTFNTESHDAPDAFNTDKD